MCIDGYGYGVTVYSRDHDPIDGVGPGLVKAECSTAISSLALKAWDPARIEQSVALPAIVQVSTPPVPPFKTVNLRDDPVPGAVVSLTRKALALPAGIGT